MSLTKEVKIKDKVIKFEFQKLAKQANGSVLVSCGDTQVLVTATAAEKPREGQSFFPLTVDYIEKFYATGRIPGGFIKRETKPSELEVLTSRVIDRPLRPSFPEGYMCETQVICTVLSYDGVNSPRFLATTGASVALMISDIPFNGPVAGMRLGMKNGEYIIDPLAEDTKELDLDIAAKPGAILMVEAGANFLSEDEILRALEEVHKLMEPLFEMQLEIQKEIGKEKRVVEKDEAPADLVSKIEPLAKDSIANAFQTKDKLLRKKALTEATDKILESLALEDSKEIETAKKVIHDLESAFVRNMVLKERKRIDGRGLEDIRPIVCESGLLKRTHGSGLFQRGETQALAAVTLGAGSDDEQRVDSITQPNHSKKFMLHYNFPPYSVGEARPLRAPGRREVGHGALAERALLPVLPLDDQQFKYTIRLVSEVLESNGSSSMATVCGGTLAMLDAGIPLKGSIAGIAMGLIKEGDDFAVLSDILGDEDHLGDMDFKVCGNEQGITALQMDIKIGGLSTEILKQALMQAKKGRDHILSIMNETIAKPNPVSQHAPKVFQVRVSSDKIKALIGPGGKMIKRIVSETGVKVDISDDGVVSLISPNSTAAEAAKTMIRTITADPEIGAFYLGTVKKLMDFGVVVEIKHGTEGLCHISQLAEKRIDKVNDVVKEGEEILVKVVDIDRAGKIKLSRKDALGKKPTVFKYE